MTDQTDIAPQIRQPFKYATLLANTLNFAGIAVAILSFCFPYLLIVRLACRLFPLLVFWVLYRYPADIAIFATRKRDALPMVGVSIVASLIPLVFYVFEIELVHFYWAVITAIGLSVLPMLFFYKHSFSQMPVSIRDRGFALTIVCCAIYIYSVMIAINCSTDRSEPQDLVVKITGMIPGGYKTSGRFVLEPWGTVTDTTDIAVSRAHYYSKGIGGHVFIHTHQGLLGFTWYEVYF